MPAKKKDTATPKKVKPEHTTNVQKKLVKSAELSEENVLAAKVTRKRKQVNYHNLFLVDDQVPKTSIQRRKSHNVYEIREKAKIAKSKKLKTKKEEKKDTTTATPEKKRRGRKPKAAAAEEKKEEMEVEKEEETEEKPAEEKKEETPAASPAKKTRGRGRKAKCGAAKCAEEPKKAEEAEEKPAAEEPKKPEEPTNVIVDLLNKKLGFPLREKITKKFEKRNVPKHIQKFLEYMPDKPLENKTHEIFITQWGLQKPNADKLKAFKDHPDAIVLGYGEGYLFTSMKEKPEANGDFKVHLGFEVLIEGGKQTEEEVVEGPFMMSEFLKGLTSEKKD